jgi:hypothetical protein
VSSVKYKLDFYIPEDDILHSHCRGNLKSYENNIDIFVVNIVLKRFRIKIVLVETICYKSEGRRFDSRSHRQSSLYSAFQPHHGSRTYSASNRN